MINKIKILSLLFLILLSLLVCPEKIYAQLQELQVNPVTNDGPIPVFRDYPNLAAVFVQSSLTNLSFESNLEIVEEMGNPAAGEYILLVQPVRQSIRVNAPGFIQSRIQLRNLEARDVIYFSIGPVTDETIPVLIRVEPTDAIVRVDGEPVDISTSIQLEEGTHTIEITGDGFKNIEQEIVVDKENNFFEFTPEEVEPQLVRIETEPAEVTVFVDGVEEGETDRNGMFDLFRFPGEYQITATKSGYLSREITIDVQETEQNRFSLQLERSAAVLTIETSPSDARISIDRRVVDASEPIEISPGLHRLELNREGYQPYVENISIEQNQEFQRQVTLEAYTGTLQVQVSPTNAEVTLTNEQGQIHDQWTGSRRITDLHVGNYRLTVEADQYQAYEESIQIEQDQTTEKEIQLSEELTPQKENQTAKSSSQPVNQTDVNNDFTVGFGTSLATRDLIGMKVETGYNIIWNISSILDVFYYPNQKNYTLINLNLNVKFRFINTEFFKTSILVGPGYHKLTYKFRSTPSYIDKRITTNLGLDLSVNLKFTHLFLQLKYNKHVEYQGSTGLRFRL